MLSAIVIFVGVWVLLITFGITCDIRHWFESRRDRRIQDGLSRLADPDGLEALWQLPSYNKEREVSS